MIRRIADSDIGPSSVIDNNYTHAGSAHEYPAGHGLQLSLAKVGRVPLSHCVQDLAPSSE